MVHLRLIGGVFILLNKRTDFKKQAIKHQLKQFLYPLLSFVAVMLIWEWIVHQFHISLYILPAPSDIIIALLDNAKVLWTHSMVTLSEACIGLGLAALLAFVIAIVMDMSNICKKSLYPHLIVTQTVPVMILGPLFAIWFGFGMTPKIIMVIFMCFFPIVISFHDAMAKADKQQLMLLKSFQAKRWQLYRYVKIPSAANAFFSGLKVAATYCIGGAIVGEWLSASAGLGYYMIRVKNGYMLDKVFACVVVIILWSLLLHFCVVWMEKLILPYQRKRRK